MGDRLMTFVDGSNLLQGTGTVIQANLRSDKPTDDALRLAGMIVRELHRRLGTEAFCYGFQHIRSYWFGSFVGNVEYEQSLRSMLRTLGFEPVIFKQKKGKEKRVDLAVAREMLIHAFGRNYDLALLVAGDEDYVDLVGDLKRLGVRVMGSFYQTGLSSDLRISFDYFHRLDIWGAQREELVGKLGGKLPR